MPAGAGAGVFEVVGWLFSAQDLASPVVTSAQQAVEAASAGIGSSLDTASTAVEKSTQNIGNVIKSAMDVARGSISDVFGSTGNTAMSIVNQGVDLFGSAVGVLTGSITSVFGDAGGTAMSIAKAGVEGLATGFSAMASTVSSGAQTLQEGFSSMASSMGQQAMAIKDSVSNVFKEGIPGAFNAAEAAVSALGVGVYSVFKEKIPDAWGSAKKLLTETQFSFKDIGTAASAMTGKLVETAGALKDSISGGFTRIAESLPSMKEGIKAVGMGLFQMGRSAASAAVQVGSLLQQQLGLNDAQKTGEKGAKKGGPIGKMGKALKGVFGLFTPIIRLLKKVFAPLIEGIMDHMSNALAPLQATMGLIAADLGPKIAKLMVPLVKMMEVVALQLAEVFSTLLSGPQLIGTINLFIGKLMPVVVKVVKALVRLVTKILPIMLGLVTKLLPIVMQVVDVLADAFVQAIEIIADIWEEVGPLLVQTFMDLLKALLPLLPPLLKLSAVLLKKVFGPLVVGAIMLVAESIKTMIPSIDFLVKFLSLSMDLITKDLTKFFGGFEKYMSDFYVLFIEEPFIKPVDKFFSETIPGWWNGFWDFLTGAGEAFVGFFVDLGESIADALGLGTLIENAKGVVGSIFGAVMAPVETMQFLANKYIVNGLNDFLEWNPPIIPGGNIADLIFNDKDYRVPKFARGGIAGVENSGGQGVVGEFGEAGPEMLLPLRPDVIQRVLAPVLPSLEMPGLERAIAVLERMDAKLGGVLRVEGMGGNQQTQPTWARREQVKGMDLSDAVGLGGI